MIAPIYLDDDIAAFDKPPGIATIPERSPLSDSFLKNAQAALNERLFVVHRLDKEVSGVILFARNAAAHKHLNDQFASRKVTKSYLLLTLGCVEPDQGGIETPIRQFGSGRMGIDPVRGKAARTDFEVVRRYAGSTLVRAFPHTGRRHQLRVHFYSISHPIAGDSRYGDKGEQSVWTRLMLHAESITFLVPSGQRLTLAVPPPPSFADVLKMLDQQGLVNSLPRER